MPISFGGTYERMRKINWNCIREKRDFGVWSVCIDHGSGVEREPETFNFLGFTHICVKREQRTVSRCCGNDPQRLQTKLNEVKAELQRRMHEPSEVGKWLQAVVRGHIRYYGVPMNQPALYLSFRSK